MYIYKNNMNVYKNRATHILSHIKTSYFLVPKIPHYICGCDVIDRSCKENMLKFRMPKKFTSISNLG